MLHVELLLLGNSSCTISQGRDRPSTNLPHSRYPDCATSCVCPAPWELTRRGRFSWRRRRTYGRSHGGMWQKSQEYSDRSV